GQMVSQMREFHCRSLTKKTGAQASLLVRLRSKLIVLCRKRLTRLTPLCGVASRDACAPVSVRLTTQKERNYNLRHLRCDKICHLERNWCALLSVCTIDIRRPTNRSGKPIQYERI